VLIAMYTGLRKGEIFKLKWQDIDLGRKQISVRAVNAKSKKERYIPLHSTLVELLTIWQAQQMQQLEWVFPNGNGKPFTDIKKAWQSVLKKAQIKKFRFHDLRHHFASQLVMKETPLNTVRELLGHADIGTTLRYAHLADYHKADAIGRLD
jgi:integrase